MANVCCGTCNDRLAIPVSILGHDLVRETQWVPCPDCQPDPEPDPRAPSIPGFLITLGFACLIIILVAASRRCR